MSDQSGSGWSHHTVVIDAVGEDLARVRKGMVEAAAAADATGVPVSWALDVRAARNSATWLNERRESRRAADPSSRDEDIILWLDVQNWLGESVEATDARSAAEGMVRQKEDLRARVQAERDRVVALLPWAKITLAGSDLKTEPLVDALVSLGFAGLWGYRWNEASRRSQDRGCPFGCFFVSRARFQSAGSPATPLVGLPRDSGRALGRHSHDVDRDVGEMTVGGDPLPIDTVLRIIEASRATPRLGAWSASIQTLAATACAIWTDDERERCVALWRSLEEQGIPHASVGDQVRLYSERFAETEPQLLVLSDGEVTVADASVRVLYYDSRAQYVFERESGAPTVFHNYVSPATQSKYLLEYEAPSLSVLSPTRDREQIRLDFSLDSPKPMPYALMLWGDHRHLRLYESNVGDVQWIGAHGVLLHLDLVTGPNDFFVVLTI